MHISITPETLFHIGSFGVTNTLFTSWVVVIFILILSLVIYKKLKGGTNKVSLLVEMVFEKFMGFMETFAGDRKTVRRFLPLVATIFFYILISNWMGTLPGVETIGIHEKEEIQKEAAVNTSVDSHGEVAAEDADSEETESSGGKFLPLLRTVNSDINMTLAIALLVVLLTHILGFKEIGAKHHLGKFIVNPFKKPIGFFVGLLELIGEVSRVISLTFRLFGNIFAGSVLMLIISSLAAFIVPIPFLAMELFVGFIQALVFATLAMMFVTSATKLHEEAH